MTHKFDVNNRHKLDNEKRRAALPPHETLIRLGYKEGADLADIGCGIGYFTIPAAKIGGNSAKIFAVDVSQIMLQEVENRANEASINNIITIKSDEYKFNLVLHEIDEKEMFIKEATEALKSAGTIALIEWQMVENGNGPPLGERISFESMTELLSKSGYKNIIKIDIGKDYYGISATKP